ncbi:RNA-directed DNA polymerase, partial [bacterium]|nr:RNA-directed DNA polymerase [bacterium]MBU1614291.1 RNA-directed DNA polymerase [bacterium]
MKCLFEQITEYENLLTAWNRVKENHGCAGVDRITIERFEERLEQNLHSLRTSLQNKTYQPLPLLKFLVDKGNGQARALS